MRDKSSNFLGFPVDKRLSFCTLFASSAMVAIAANYPALLLLLLLSVKKRKRHLVISQILK